MDVVNFAHTGDSQHHVGNTFQAHPLGSRFEQNVSGLYDYAEGAPKDHATDKKGKQGVDKALACQADEPAAADDVDVVERITQIMNKDSAQVEIPPTPRHCHGDAAVDEQRQRTHGHHHACLDGFGMYDPLVAFVTEEESYAGEDERVYEGSQHPSALVAKSLLVVGRPTLEIKGQPSQRQAGQVSQVVPAIADQRQAVGERPSDEFGGHQPKRDQERELYRPGGRVHMRVVMHCAARSPILVHAARWVQTSLLVLSLNTS